MPKINDLYEEFFLFLLSRASPQLILTFSLLTQSAIGNVRAVCTEETTNERKHSRYLEHMCHCEKAIASTNKFVFVSSGHTTESESKEIFKLFCFQTMLIKGKSIHESYVFYLIIHYPLSTFHFLNHFYS